MKKARLRNNVFHRIGNRYAPYFDHDHFMGHSGIEDVGTANSKSNSLVNPNNQTLEIPLPGYKREEINLAEVDGKLLISAKKGAANSYKDDYLRQELHLEEHEQSFDLSDHIDVNNITAVLSNGVLKINLPYTEQIREQPAVRSIGIS